MKIRFRKIIVMALTAALLLSLMSLISYAKDMEECYHCSKTGEFHCPTCGNEGVVVCDGCHGRGRFECPGEEDKGKCDNGYYVCPSCNGDGLSRPIPADGNADPCGQCGGTGKLECWHCHGAGIIICDRCNGEGKCACQNGNCIEARKIDYKCPYCKGTGYLGDGPDFPQEWNDGVHNVPEKGDHIITDHASWTGYYYGTGETDKDKQQGGEDEDDLSERRDPVTGRDYVWFIDVGDGVFDVEDQHIVVTRDGSAVSGILDVKYNDIFKLEGITNWSTHIYLVADGFKTELSGRGEYSVANRTPKSPKVPFNVKMEIEYIEGSAPVESGFQAKHFVDFGTGSWDVGGKTVTILLEGEPVSGTVETDEGAVITFDGLDRDTMTVYLCGKNDFRVTLIPSGDDKFAMGIYEPKDAVLSGGVLSFDIEYRPQETEETTEDQSDGHHGGEGIPDDRNSDFDIISRPEEGVGQRSSAVVEVSRMTDDEQRYYAGLSDQELTGIVDSVKTIVESAQPGRCEDGENDLLTLIAHDNGFESLKDGRIYPIYFEGHIDIGFPVRVFVTLEKGELDGGTDIYVYHQLNGSGEIESLGKAEYDTYDDGSIHSISFYTTGFSTFFTASKDLDLNWSESRTVQSGQDEQTKQPGSDTQENKPFPVVVAVIIAVCAAAVMAVVTVVIIITVKKKRS